jgi:hypothetical protein
MNFKAPSRFEQSKVSQQSHVIETSLFAYLNLRKQLVLALSDLGDYQY